MAIKRFDHAVLLANDEPRARAFYQDVLGARVEKAFVRRKKGEAYSSSFLQIGSEGQVVGLFSDPVKVPEPRGVRDWPAVVFIVPPAVYDRARQQLEGTEEIWLVGGAAQKTFYTQDSEGNAIGFVAGNKGPNLLRLEVDVPDLEAGVRFYEEALGLPLEETGVMPNSHELFAWFAIGEDQGVFLVERPDAPGPNPGQHFAFLVGRDDHLALKEHLVRIGVDEVPGHEDGDRPPREIGTYLRDPWDRKMQWITHADTE